MKLVKIVTGALLALTVACGTFTACSKNTESNTVGVLSFLNRSEEDHAAAFWAKRATIDLLTEQGYISPVGESVKKRRPANPPKIKYYDDLDSLIMALKSGEIRAIDGLSQTTANYLVSHNDSIQKELEVNFEKERPAGSFADDAFRLLADSFSFMFLEKNVELCNQFSAVIAELKATGELDTLVNEQIYGQMNGGEIKPLPIENVSGRETIKVAVTGSLPPMDYVASDGTFAGFNTALLAVIGKKLNKNIEIVQVSSGGRATALASETVDVVFWTRSTEYIEDATERNKYIEMQKGVYTPIENDAIEAMLSVYPSFDNLVNRDIPEGTVTTIPYFMDIAVPVALQK